MENRNVKWHKMTADAAVAQLHTNAAGGLTRRAARSRLRKLGPNTLFDAGKNNLWSVWRAVLTDPSILLLLFSVFLTVFFAEVGQTITALVAFAAVVTVAIGYTLRIVAWHRTVALYRVPTVFVLRDGRVFELSARNVVVGDIVLLQKGDIVPADCRVLDTDGTVCARLFYRDGTGKLTALEQTKKGDLVYPYESRVFAPHCENILYGKSEIVEGTVRALVTEVGAYSYAGATQQPASIAEEERLALRHMLSGVTPYLRLLGLLLLVLLIPVTVISLLTAPDGQNAIRTFLPLGILCGMGAQGLTVLLFYIVQASGAHQCIHPEQAKNRSIPKSVSAFDKLSDITDLIVVGRAASSDGVMHLYRAALGDGEVSLTEPTQPLLAPMCEALELLFSAPALSRSQSQETCNLRDLEDPVLREELRGVSAYDLDMLSIRLKRASAYYQSDRIILEVEFKDTNLRYCFTDRVNLLYSCTNYEKDGKILPLDSRQRANLLRFCETSIAESGHPTVIFRQAGNRAVLLGVLTCREEILHDLPAIREELHRRGVRVSYFLQTDDYENLCYANSAGLAKKVCRKSELAQGEGLMDRFANDRVFLGFSNQEIREMIYACKQQGSRFAVFGSDAETFSLRRDAEVRIACDPLTRDLRRNGTLQSTIPVESGFFDGQYSRSLSAHANLLLPRADRDGGGLASLLHAHSVSRTARYRMCLLCRYLVSMLSLRVTLVTFCACFGTGLISGAQLLWGGLLLDLLVLPWLLRTPISQERLRTRCALDERFLLRTLTDASLLFPLAATAISLAIYAFIFTCTGLMTDADATTFIFYSFVILSLINVYRTARVEWRAELGKRDLIVPATLLLPSLVITGFSFLLPSLRTACEVGSFSIASLASLPLAPLLYFFFRFLSPRLQKNEKKR